MKKLDLDFAWKSSTIKTKTFAIAAFIFKLTFHISLFLVLYSITIRTVTVRERILLCIVGICYLLNKWFVEEMKNGSTGN